MLTVKERGKLAKMHCASVLPRRNPLDINDNRWYTRTEKKRKTPTTPTMKLATVQSKKERRKERTKRIV
jgi:hypothetical protein